MIQRILNGWQGSNDALEGHLIYCWLIVRRQSKTYSIVCYLAILKRNIEINTDKDALAVEVEIGYRELV